MEKGTEPRGISPSTITSSYSTDGMMNILLLVTTILFSVATQIISTLDHDIETQKSGIPNYIIWLMFEMSAIALFSSILYLATSYKIDNIKTRDYKDVSLAQMIITNGILFTIILYYISGQLVQDRTALLNLDNKVYLISTMVVFIVIPLYVYMGSIKRTSEVVIILLGGFVDQNYDEAPIVASIFGSILGLLLALLIGVSEISKTLNVITLAVLFIFLPYIGISAKEKLKEETTVIERVTTYILNSSSIYYIAVLISGLIDYFLNTISRFYVIIIIILSLILWILSLTTFTGKSQIKIRLDKLDLELDLDKLDKWIAIGICGESIVFGLLVIINKIRGSLMGIMFFLYVFILTLTLGSILLAELFGRFLHLLRQEGK
jgi:hypothetical protein